jgi:hypothetical protein
VANETPCDDEDKLLFAACTTITLGDEKRASFWDFGWIQGHRPKHIAPGLFELSTKKKRIVHGSLLSDN